MAKQKTPEECVVDEASGELITKCTIELYLFDDGEVLAHAGTPEVIHIASAGDADSSAQRLVNAAISRERARHDLFLQRLRDEKAKT